MPSQSETETITQAIHRALDFIAQQQLASGEFMSQASRTVTPFRPEWSWQTNFVPSLILGALNKIDTDEALGIRQRLAAYLLTQQHSGAFNYWSDQARQRRVLPYPDDLDDTFCAWSALYGHQPALVDEQVLAQLVRQLLATEAAVGGPYRTWLVAENSPSAWRDVDLAVNANITYFFRLLGRQLPNLTRLLDEAITQDDFASAYYPAAYPVVYYLARAYRGTNGQKLLDSLQKLQSLPNLNPLQAALCLTARYQLGDYTTSQPSIRQLLRAQQADGSWPAAAFYAEPSHRGKPRYGGGAALTTALACEALWCQLARLDRLEIAVQKPARQGAVKDAAKVRQRVLKLAQQQLRPQPPAVKKTVYDLLRSQANSSSGEEILRLPYSLAGDLPVVMRPERRLLDELALANLYGWAAYTVYDNFLDDEGQPSQLPAANVVMRYSLFAFHEAVPDKAFQQLVRDVFDKIDGANAWELSKCRWRLKADSIVVGRLPDYGDRRQLANRSLGHTLPALAVLWLADNTDKRRTNNQQVSALTEAMTHYLIVRQLNDDLHDWSEDLDLGHISYVLAVLLRAARLTPRTTIVRSELINRLRTLFWQTTINQVCDVMRSHIGLGRQALEQVTMLQSDNSISRLLDRQEATINDTERQQTEAQQFLRYYRQPPASKQIKITE